MADFFTVTLRRKQIISRYDAKGKRTGETETWLEERHHDCPAMLVATYRRDFPENVVAVELQPRQNTLEPRRSSVATFGRRLHDADASQKRQGRPQAASERADAPIHVDGYAQAVSAAARREARV